MVGFRLFVFLLRVNIQCEDGQMETGIEVAKQLGSCRLENDYGLQRIRTRQVLRHLVPYTLHHKLPCKR